MYAEMIMIRHIQLSRWQGATVLCSLALTFCVSATLSFLFVSGDIGPAIGVHAGEADLLPSDGVLARIYSPYDQQLLPDVAYDVTVFFGDQLSEDRKTVLKEGDRVDVRFSEGVDVQLAHYLYRSHRFDGDGEFICTPQSSLLSCEVTGGDLYVDEGHFTIRGVQVKGVMEGYALPTLDVHVIGGGAVLAEMIGGRMDLVLDGTLHVLDRADPAATLAVTRMANSSLPISDTVVTEKSAQEVRVIRLVGYKELYIIDADNVLRPLSRETRDALDLEPQELTWEAFVQYEMGRTLSEEETQEILPL